MADTLEIFGTTYANVAGFKATDDNSQTKTYIRPQGTKSITANGSGIDVAEYAAVDVDVSGGGTTEADEKDVNFIDYDGTILYSYTAAEAQALSALPANPTHTGLTSQGWNWTLAQIKSQLTNVGGKVWVGQMYITDDGKTRIYIHIPTGTVQSKIGFCVRLTSSVANNTTLDWGDGYTETVGSTSAQDYSHLYSSAGDYIVKLTVNTGTVSFIGSGTSQTSGSSIYGTRASSSFGQYINKIEIGSGVTTIGLSSLMNCLNLEAITISKSVTNIGQRVFSYCLSLKAVVIPDSIRTIENYAFIYCYNIERISLAPGINSIGTSAFSVCWGLRSITLPNSITTVANTLFSTDYSIQEITLPDGITSLGAGAFQNCPLIRSFTIPESVTSISANVWTNDVNIAEYHFFREVPPTLANTNAFTNIASDCIIYVPYSADHSILEAYQNATNWSTYASYIYEEAAP